MKVVKIDIKKSGNTIGYIMGSGDEVADSLRNLDYDVTLLSDEMLENEDLTPFDAIITGIRDLPPKYRSRSYVKTSLRPLHSVGEDVRVSGETAG